MENQPRKILGYSVKTDLPQNPGMQAEQRPPIPTPAQYPKYVQRPSAADLNSQVYNTYNMPPWSPTNTAATYVPGVMPYGVSHRPPPATTTTLGTHSPTQFGYGSATSAIGKPQNNFAAPSFAKNFIPTGYGTASVPNQLPNIFPPATCTNNAAPMGMYGGGNRNGVIANTYNNRPTTSFANNNCAPSTSSYSMAGPYNYSGYAENVVPFPNAPPSTSWRNLANNDLPNNFATNGRGGPTMYAGPPSSFGNQFNPPPVNYANNYVPNSNYNARFGGIPANSMGNTKNNCLPHNGNLNDYNANAAAGSVWMGGQYSAPSNTYANVDTSNARTVFPEYTNSVANQSNSSFGNFHIGSIPTTNNAQIKHAPPMDGNNYVAKQSEMLTANQQNTAHSPNPVEIPNGLSKTEHNTANPDHISPSAQDLKKAIKLLDLIRQHEEKTRTIIDESDKYSTEFPKSSAESGKPSAKQARMGEQPCKSNINLYTIPEDDMVIDSSVPPPKTPRSDATNIGAGDSAIAAAAAVISLEINNSQTDNDASKATLLTARRDELTKRALEGCEIAEKLAQIHRHRPCFKKIDTLCARTKQELLREEAVLPNINSQGIAWAVKDLILVFTRAVNAWSILRGYAYNTPEDLNEVKSALGPEFDRKFAVFQDATYNLIGCLTESFVKLDIMVQEQNKCPTSAASLASKQIAANNTPTNSLDSMQTNSTGSVYRFSDYMSLLPTLEEVEENDFTSNGINVEPTFPSDATSFDTSDVTYFQRRPFANPFDFWPSGDSDFYAAAAASVGYSRNRTPSTWSSDSN